MRFLGFWKFEVTITRVNDWWTFLIENTKGFSPLLMFGAMSEQTCGVSTASLIYIKRFAKFKRRSLNCRQALDFEACWQGRWQVALPLTAKVFPTYLQIISRISAINCKIFSKYLQNICKILSKISSKYLQDISKTKTYKDMWIFETLNTTNDYSEIFIACQVKRMQNGYEKREIWMGC